MRPFRMDRMVVMLFGKSFNDFFRAFRARSAFVDFYFAIHFLHFHSIPKSLLLLRLLDLCLTKKTLCNILEGLRGEGFATSQQNFSSASFFVFKWKVPLLGPSSRGESALWQGLLLPLRVVLHGLVFVSTRWRCLLRRRQKAAGYPMSTAGGRPTRQG